MTTVENRSAREIGNSLYISLPAGWVKRHVVRKETKVDVIVGECIVVLPPRDLTNDEIDSMFDHVAQVVKAVRS